MLTVARGSSRRGLWATRMRGVQSVHASPEEPVRTAPAAVDSVGSHMQRWGRNLSWLPALLQRRWAWVGAAPVTVDFAGTHSGWRVASQESHIPSDSSWGETRRSYN